MLLANMDKVFASGTSREPTPNPHYDEDPNSYYQYNAFAFFNIRSRLSMPLLTRDQKDENPSIESRLLRNQGMLMQYDHAIRYEESRIECLQAKLMQKSKEKEQVVIDLDNIFQREFDRLNRAAILAKDKYAFVYEDECKESLITIDENESLQAMQKRHNKIIHNTILAFEQHAVRNLARQDYHANKIIEYSNSRAYVQTVVDELNIEREQLASLRAL